MDVLTHGLLGAAVAQATASRDDVRLAALVGLGAGMLPDADALLGSSADPLRVIELHRHFTHALLFVPIGALLATLLLRIVAPVRRRLSFARTYRFALLGYLPAGFLDACTSYGTHLWWPFSEARVAWSVIAIVGPLFSLTLAAALLAGVLRSRATPARLGLALAALSLVAGTVQHARADALARELAASRGHVPEQLAVKPTIGNLVLWRATYAVDGVAYADGIRPGLLGEARLYPGESSPLLDAERDVAAPPGTRARRDLARFSALSDGMVARAPPRSPSRRRRAAARAPTTGAPPGTAARRGARARRPASGAPAARRCGGSARSRSPAHSRDRAPRLQPSQRARCRYAAARDEVASRTGSDARPRSTSDRFHGPAVPVAAISG